MHLILTFMILFSIHSYSQCPINYSIQNLLAGSYTFTTTTSQISIINHTQTFIYTFSNTFQLTPSSAIAINSFDIDSSQITNINFILTITSITNFNMNFTFSYNTKVFSLMQINYLVGSRNDLILGYSQYSVNNKQFTISLNKPIASSLNTTISRVFINGIQFGENINPNNKLNISLSVTTISKSYLTLYLSGFSADLIQSVWFSYIIFSPFQASFASYGGSLAVSSFVGNQLYNLNSNIYQSSYRIFGIVNLVLNHNNNFGTVNVPTQFSFSINDNFIASLISSNTQINYININYIIIGVSPKLYCKDCQSYPNAFNSQCVSNCPINTYLVQYQDGGMACMKCFSQLNQQLNINKDGCTCTNGRTLNSNGYCDLSNIPQYLPLPLWMTNNQQNSAYNWNMYSINSNLSANGNNNSVIQNPCSINQQLKNGNCVCLQNYNLINGICQLNNSSINCPINSVWNGSQCLCITGFIMLNNYCQSNQISCSPNSYWNGVQCLCISGYSMINNICTFNQSGCPANSFNNGLGFCICQQGYYNISGNCQSIQKCPINSILQQNGNCICNQGYLNISNFCLKCQPGQYFDKINSVCVQYCGQNSIFNNVTNQCQCISNYGIKTNNKCEICVGSQFMIVNNYCVTCPINQQFNLTSGICQCKNDYYMSYNGGGCVYKCANNEVYNLNYQKCECVNGLGRINGVCQLCTNSTFVDIFTQNCVQCQPNSYYLNGACLCQNTYVKTASGQCLPCNFISNSFLINGTICATCPGQKIFNGSTCVCPSGTVSIGLRCISSCLSDQYVDQNGNCFICPINQIYVNGTCQCKNNYQMKRGVCQLVCPYGQFQYKGRCAMCPLNLQYYSIIKGCACPLGYYMNINMQCILFVGTPISCPSNQYLDSALGCKSCNIPNCLSCSSNIKCVQCASTYSNVNGSCINYCGDGVISISQQCDDGNSVSNDGCSNSCRIQQNYLCVGQPSICKYTGPIVNLCGNGVIQGNQTCDDKNTINGDGCSNICTIQVGYNCIGQPSICTLKTNINGLTLYNPVQTNINNVLVSLKTNPAFTFANEAEMQSFMKSSYTSSSQPTTYCIQRQSPDLNIFDCLLIYPSGVPISAFNASFWFNYQGKTGNLTLNINPLLSGSSTRSLR